MGKRSNFERMERDLYPTPPQAVAPLFPHLTIGQRFCEPCAGNGQLIDFLVAGGMICAGGWDIEPGRKGIQKADALKKTAKGMDCFITNPPWKREILHPLIMHLSDMAPTWLLFDADWKHTQQAIPYLERCHKIVSVGRVKWFPESGSTGKDNCAWYLFMKGPRQCEGPIFIGRRR